MINSRKILIVDDEPAIAETICYSLEKESLQYHWSNTLENARCRLLQEPFDLIILDVSLPDGNGMEFCKEIRKAIQTPIIFLTALGDEIDRIVGLEIGADDYVVKPFSPRELMARVKNILRRVVENKQNENSSNEIWEVNTESYQISFQGQALSLSRYEYLILELLIRRPKKVFTRNELMDLVWDEPDSSFDRTVDAHIKNIRNKLREVSTDQNYIKTHRGIGYSLSE